MTKEDFFSLNSQIDNGIETMKKDNFTWPVLLLESCKRALRELYIKNLKLEARVCGLRVPSLIMTGANESRKTAGDLCSRAEAIREELKSLGA